MKSNARIIYKSYMSYFHTFLPVYFYGMSNGKIQIMYAQYCDSRISKSGLEFIFADHEDFIYDFNADKIYLHGYIEVTRAEFAHLVDKPEQRIKIFSISQHLNNYSEAEQFLSNKSHPRLDYFVMEQMY